MTANQFDPEGMAEAKLNFFLALIVLVAIISGCVFMGGCDYAPLEKRLANVEQSQEETREGIQKAAIHLDALADQLVTDPGIRQTRMIALSKVEPARKPEPITPPFPWRDLLEGLVGAAVLAITGVQIGKFKNFQKMIGGK